MPFRPQYAGIRQFFDVVTDTSLVDFTVTSAGSGAGFSTAGTLWMGVCGQNRVGFNDVTALKQVDYTIGSKIVVTLKSTLRLAAEDIHKYIIVASTTNNTDTIYRLADIEGYEIDQRTPKTLPIVVELKFDEHIQLNTTVANAAALPSTSKLLHGMGRAVTTTGKYYLYNSLSTDAANGDTVLAASTGRWEMIGTLSAAIYSLTSLPGCNVSLDELDNENDLLVKPPVYNLTGGSSTPLKFWVANPYITIPESIPAGTRLGIDIYLNNELKSKLFHGKLEITFKGYANIVTGELDIRNADNTADMQYINAPTTYIYGKAPSLVLQKPLEADRAFMFEIDMKCSAYEFKNLVKKGSSVSIYPFFYTQAGEYNPMGILIGDCIFASEAATARRILADVSTGVIAMPGSGIVDNLQFPVQDQRAVTGLLPNTVNQKITINGNGACFVDVDGVVQTTEALRALVSLSAGVSPLLPWSSAFNLASPSSLNITVTHPSDTLGFGTVRSDYPDVIAGMYQGRFNPTKVAIFLLQQSTNSIFRFDFDCLKQPTQVINIASNINSGTIITSNKISALPSISDPAFSLYRADGVSIATGTGGSLPSGLYQVTVGYVYDGNQVTKISHSVIDGCLPEVNSTMSDILNSMSYWTKPIDKSILRTVLSTDIKHGTERKVISGTNLYKAIYNTYATNSDDDDVYIKPSNLLSSSSGRWILDLVTSKSGIIDSIIPYIIALS